MLRATSILSIATWMSVLVGATVVMWPIALLSYRIQYAILLVLALGTTVPCIVMLIHNRPFFVSLPLLISIFAGILFGIVGLGMLVHCLLSVIAPGSFIRPPAVEWFYGINNAIMLAIPISWAFLWRDHRNKIADEHLTKRCSQPLAGVRSSFS